MGRKRTVGLYHAMLARESREKILSVLGNGDWHTFQEIREKAGLSTLTLFRHLRRMMEGGIVECKRGNEIGRDTKAYFYRLTSQATPILQEEKQKEVAAITESVFNHLERLLEYIDLPIHPKEFFMFTLNTPSLLYKDILLLNWFLSFRLLFFLYGYFSDLERGDPLFYPKGEKEMNQIMKKLVVDQYKVAIKYLQRLFKYLAGKEKVAGAIEDNIGALTTAYLHMFMLSSKEMEKINEMIQKALSKPLTKEEKADDTQVSV